MRSLSVACALFVFVGCSGKDGADGGGKTDLRMARDLATEPEDLTMVNLLGTGEPCTKSSECGGTKAQCRTNLVVPWPGGYCTSACDPKKNDPDTDINPACPGDNGTCIGMQCETACTAMSGSNPCQRAGYLCFQSCRPKELSECDPSKRGSCPQDGGATFTVTEPIIPDGGIPDGGDAGVRTVTKYSGRACVKTASDQAGVCANGCDPLAGQTKVKPSPPCEDGQGCYPNYQTGEGNCFGVSGAGGDDGVNCRFINNCDPGFACFSGKCRQLCGGPKKVACKVMGQKCIDLSMNVKVDVLGRCSP